VVVVAVVVVVVVGGVVEGRRGMRLIDVRLEREGKEGQDFVCGIVRCDAVRCWPGLAGVVQLPACIE
jgi:hypothetical protein